MTKQNMHYIEAIEDFRQSPRPRVFLAGGITNCPDWQAEVVKNIKNLGHSIAPDITLLNPRRKNFPIHDPNAAKEQIQWEYNALWSADIVSFWFSSGESNQPIVMYEFGVHLTRKLITNNPLLVIGVHPDYSRKADVKIQLSLTTAKNTPISKTIDEHTLKIAEAVDQWLEING